ncbi:extracellular solute-binding protein [uncultured Pseudokineococcus sp.]|uniref:ABC transporter substrate-binding protein n=1 Tax=uncultured Pseudokineococcus sp. TaxID=1642928 RepID=UPI00261CF683|nr:extracellular solute-binding protein [uncultured Pseudokineococcus sp.]
MRLATQRSTALAAAMGLALTLTSCSGGDDDAAVEDVIEQSSVGAMEDFGVGDTFQATEPVSFSLLYRDHPNYPNDPDWLFYQTLEEEHGVTLETTLAPLSDWEQRRSLVIGAGDAPDFIPVTYPGQEAPYVASGAILPVSDYVELMPNFQAKVEEWGLEEEIDSLRQEDGKFYLLPGLLQDLRPDYTVGIRTDVLEELGLEEPTSWDELRTAFEAMKERDPASYPFSDRWEGESLLNYAAPAFGTIGGWGFGDGVVWDEEAGEYVFAPTTDEYREMVEYFRGLVEDGLMDPESFTQSDEDALAKLANEQSYAISTNSQEILGARTALDASVGTDAYALSKTILPAGPAGDVVGGTRLENGLMVSSTAVENDDFTAMMQFIDWLYYSDEGMEFAKWGVEGETYTKTGGERMPAEDVTFTGLNPGAQTDMQSDYGFFNGVYMFASGSTRDLVLSNLYDEEVAWQEEMLSKESVPVPPPYPLDEIEREQVSLYQTALTDLTRQGTLQFILGQRDIADYDAFIGELEASNLDAYLQTVNEAQQRFAETNG